MFHSYVKQNRRLMLVGGSTIFPYTSSAIRRGCYPASGATAPPAGNNVLHGDHFSGVTQLDHLGPINLVDSNHHGMSWDIVGLYMAVCQNLVPLVNIKIAGKRMFIPLKMVSIGIDPYPHNRILMQEITSSNSYVGDDDRQGI